MTNKVVGAGNQQERPNTDRVPESLGWYVTGFVDGEGSFNVSLRKKPDYRLGWQPVLSFNVSQRDITMLTIMKHFFGCGIIKRRKDGLYSYDVTNPKAIKEKILPFFEKFSFLSNNKRTNFAIFSKIVLLMYDKEHLSPEGFKKLLELRRDLNKGKGRKRKYTYDSVKESSETIRQTHNGKI